MIKRFILAAALALTATPALAASLLFGTDEKNTYTVDTSNGTVTLVGATGLSGFDANGYGSILRDLTSSSTTLYGAQWNVDANGITGSVATVDATTGAVTSSVAVTGLIGAGTNNGLYSVAYDRTTNILYGNSSRRLYTINTTTGVATLVGNLQPGSIIGLGIDDSTGTLFAISQIVDPQNVIQIVLRTLDKANASVLSTVTLANQCACDIAFDPLTNQGYVSSAFYDANDNFLYAGLDALNGVGPGTTFVGQHGPAAPFGMSGLAFLGVTGAVPEPASWALMMTGFGLVGYSMRRARRQQSSVFSVA
jgi:PEP-CTERM motif